MMALGLHSSPGPCLLTSSCQIPATGMSKALDSHKGASSFCMSLAGVLPLSGVNFLQGQNATQAASARRAIELWHHRPVIFQYSEPPTPTLSQNQMAGGSRSG